MAEPQTVYVVILEDRHTDVDVQVYRDRHRRRRPGRCVMARSFRRAVGQHAPSGTRSFRGTVGGHAIRNPADLRNPRFVGRPLERITMDPVAHCPEDCDGPECDCPPRAGGACPWHAWQHAAGHLAAELDAARARVAELEAENERLRDELRSVSELARGEGVRFENADDAVRWLSEPERVAELEAAGRALDANLEALARNEGDLGGMGMVPLLYELRRTSDDVLMTTLLCPPGEWIAWEPRRLYGFPRGWPDGFHWRVYAPGGAEIVRWPAVDGAPVVQRQGDGWVAHKLPSSRADLAGSG
jgi:hypothetical protein